MNSYINNYSKFDKTVIYNFHMENGGIGDYIKFAMLILSDCMNNNIKFYIKRNDTLLEQYIKLKFENLYINEDEITKLSDVTILRPNDYYYKHTEFANLKLNWNEVFYFSDIVKSNADKLFPNHVKEYISLHIRLGDKNMPDQMNHPNDDRVFNEKKLYEFIETNSKKNIFCVSDNQDYKLKIKNKYNNIIITDIDIRHTASQKTTSKQILDGVTEFYLLTKSQLIYCPNHSGFSKVAAKFRNIKYIDSSEIIAVKLVSYCINDSARDLMMRDAKKLGRFTEIKLFTLDDLKMDATFWNIHKDFISKTHENSKCYFSLVRSYIIKKEMDNMKPGDILFYLDGACRLNTSNELTTKDFKSILEDVSTSGCWRERIQCFRGNLIKTGVKKDALIKLNACKGIVISKQMSDTQVVLFVVRDEMKKLVNDWYKLSCDYSITDDTESISPNLPEFNYHDGVNCIFSILSAKAGGITRQFFYPKLLLHASENPIKIQKEVEIFILCHNEAILLPHTIKHYKSYLPNCKITILDNKSTDDSKEIAIKLGCNVIEWESKLNGADNDFRYVELKNNIWKSEIQGWVILCDMDEWLCVSSEQLEEEERRGTTILTVKGFEMMGESSSLDLSDIDLFKIEKYSYNHIENKNLCFLRGPIKEINYDPGCHKSNPVGHIEYSSQIYINKHMNFLGQEYIIDKLERRKERLKEQLKKYPRICLNYQIGNKEIVNRYKNRLVGSKSLETIQNMIKMGEDFESINTYPKNIWVGIKKEETSE